MFPKNAIEKAKDWAQRMRARRAEVPAPEPAPQPKWNSSTFHVEVLSSTSCPDCRAEKKVGDYRCAPCARGVQK